MCAKRNLNPTPPDETIVPMVTKSRLSKLLCAGSYLITDFDGTCTVTDTTPLVPHLAARASTNPSAVLSRFRELEDLYMSLLGRCKADFMVESSSSPATFDAAGLEKALASMDAVSDAVTEQLSTSGILAGIEADSVAGVLDEWLAAPEPPIQPPALRDGCAAALAAAAADGWQLGVLTLNWCPPVVHSYLPVLTRTGASVWSNRIDGCGGVSAEVNGAAAKQQIIAQLVREARAAGGESAGVVYVGDSATDLLAMLEADLGILIGESETTRRIARQFGLRIEALPTAASAIGDAGADRKGVIWEAASWADICRCLELKSGVGSEQAATR